MYSGPFNLVGTIQSSLRVLAFVVLALAHAQAEADELRFTLSFDTSEIEATYWDREESKHVNVNVSEATPGLLDVSVYLQGQVVVPDKLSPSEYERNFDAGFRSDGREIGPTPHYTYDFVDSLQIQEVSREILTQNPNHSNRNLKMVPQYSFYCRRFTDRQRDVREDISTNPHIGCYGEIEIHVFIDDKSLFKFRARQAFSSEAITQSEEGAFHFRDLSLAKLKNVDIEVDDQFRYRGGERLNFFLPYNGKMINGYSGSQLENYLKQWSVKSGVFGATPDEHFPLFGPSN